MDAETGFARIKRAFEAYAASFKQAKAAHESVSDLVSSAEYELEQVRKDIAASGVRLPSPAGVLPTIPPAAKTNIVPLRPLATTARAQTAPTAARAAGERRSTHGT